MVGLVENKNAVDIFLTRIFNNMLSFVLARNTIPVYFGKFEAEKKTQSE